MGRGIMAIVALLALSACHFGFGIGANDQQPTRVANSPLGSSIAQASVGNAVPANE